MGADKIKNGDEKYKSNGIDAMFDVFRGGIPGNHYYPIILCLVAYFTCWPQASMAFFVTNMVVVYPDEVYCGGELVSRNQCINQTETGSCDDFRFEFEDGWAKQTLITEYDLSCTENSFLQDVNSVSVIGCIVGSLIFGNISDIIGRWTTLLLCSSVTAAAGLIMTFVTEY